MANPPTDPEVTWPGSPAFAPSRLVLTWGAHEMEVTQQRPSLTVGRGESNGIVIKDGKVSRVHARIEYRNGHFALIDQSVNGTYLASSAGVSCKVSNETYLLMDAGSISFGLDPASARTHLIRYTVKH
jgi:adenylate cyclase